MRSPLLPTATLATNLSSSPNNITFLLSMQSSSSDTPGSSHHLPSELQDKILYGERRPPNSNRIVGAHSPKIKTDPNFTVRVINNNSDGTTFVESIKQFPDGSFSRPKKSTLAPDSWSDAKIIDVTNQVATTPTIHTRSSDGVTFHRETVDGVEWLVIKDAAGNIESSYPTGGNPITF